MFSNVVHDVGLVGLTHELEVFLVRERFGQVIPGLESVVDVIRESRASGQITKIHTLNSESSLQIFLVIVSHTRP